VVSEDNKSGMDPQLYVETLGLENMWGPDSGDQCLILPDIMACFKDCNVIALPYPCPGLAMYLGETGKKVLYGYMQGADAVYWGTPTIVGNKALFPKCLQPGVDASYWTKERERHLTRAWVEKAEQFKLKVIVTGLGTGDISPVERMSDMGKGATVVSYKVFGEFSDWVICRRLK